ncbi:MAG: bifunctional diguanylate cyclase/phosphodiesterase [Actinomycetota bacterium]
MIRGTESIGKRVISPAPIMLEDIRTTLRGHRLSALLLCTIAAGALLLVHATRTLEDEPFYGDHPLIFLAFCGLLFAAELRPMPSLTDETELTASWAFAFTLLFVAPLAGAVGAVMVCSTINDLRNRKRLDRTLFNAAQFALSLTAGGAVGSLITDVRAVADGEPVTPSWLVAVLLACAVGFAANSVFVSVAVAFHAGLPVPEMLRRSLGINLGMDGLLLALAPIFVVVGLESLLLVPLLLATVWIIFNSAALALRNKHEATHDQLTGIPNRRMFEDHLALVMDAARGTRQQFALVQIDLDGFKGINDRLGHHYGDLVLKAVASRLTSNERLNDQCARLGGDEFALLFLDIRSLGDASTIANRALARIAEPLDVEGVPLRVGASLGVAVFPVHGDEPQRLMHHADMAMYEAKRQGGGVRVYEPGEDDDGPGRIELLTDLAVATVEDQLVLEYQPKFEIDSGRLTMVEALVRWHHPEHGVVPPGWFMPQAEQTDLINRLTDQIIEMAARQLRDWRNAGIDVPVAVNVSARNLHDLRFPSRVKATLDRYEIDGRSLEVEVTENSVMEDPSRSGKVLSELRSLGITVAIDDFGTGYSSLSTLRDLTLDRIKIDRSFITGLATDTGDLTIARSVIELAHNLGMSTVAEGVETNEVLEMLRSLGCDEVQGFLLARPQPAEALEAMLRAGRTDLGTLIDQPVSTP